MLHRPVYVRRLPREDLTTSELPPGTGTKGKFFIRLPTHAIASRFVGNTDKLPKVQGIIGYVLDPETFESHRVVISRNEETCIFDGTHDPGSGHRPRTPEFALWRTVETDTGGSGSGGFRGFIEGEVEE